MSLTGYERSDLLERAYELELIDSALEAARSDTGTLLLIEAAAGEGKTALLRAAQARAADSPLLVVDDAHQLSAASLGELAHRHQAETAVIVAFRPGEPGADEAALDRLRSTTGAVRVRLGPLSVGSVGALIRRRLHRADDGAATRVHELSGGNPLYVEELLARAPGCDHVIAVGDRILRRAAALSPDGPRLLLAMAVLGDHERLELAAKVAGVDMAAAGAVAHGLRRMEILAGEDPFRFTQPLVRRSIYEGSPEAQRARAHEVAAAGLQAMGRPAADVAAHLARLPADGSTAVSAGLIAAAEAAVDAGDKVRWLRRALDERAPAPPRADLLEQLGTIEVSIRDAAAIGHLDEILDITGDPSQRARVGIALAEVLAYAGRWEDALVTLARIEADLGSDTEDVQVAFLATTAVAAAFDPSRVHIYDQLLPRLEEAAQGSSWAAHALSALLASVTILRGGPAAVALGHSEAALGDGILLSQGAGSWATPQLLQALASAEALDRALATCNAVDAAARDTGAEFGHAIAAAYRSHALACGGDLIAAEREARRALAVLPEPGLAMVTSTLYFLFGEILLERPSLADVAAGVELLTMPAEFMETWSGANLMWPRALLRLARGDRAAGVADLRAVGRQADALGFGPAFVPWRSALARQLAGDAREEALALVEAEMALAHTSGLPRPLGRVQRVAGALIGGTPGIQLLHESLLTLADTPSPLERARSLVELGAALRRDRRLAAARGPLNDGLELAASCGAVRLATRARAELGAAAGRPVRQVVDNGALTSSELRVARLAAAGSSNRAIADELYISLKTVETHLSRVYAKFGLMGRGARGQLAAALAAYEPRA